MSCACATYVDGSTYTGLCAEHADTDPCYTVSQVTGRRRKGTIRRGVCTRCGWQRRAVTNRTNKD